MVSYQCKYFNASGNEKTKSRGGKEWFWGAVIDMQKVLSKSIKDISSKQVKEIKENLKNKLKKKK